MEDQGGKTNKEKSPKQSNEKHKLERQSEYQSLPELLQTERNAKKDAMATAIKENMKAVEKSNE